MKINWKVRVKNPIFWVNIVIAIVAPILAYFGLEWKDMTTWGKLGELFLQALQNPVVIVAMVVSVWNAVNDPTTKGLADSEKAMTYKEPR